MPSGAAPAAREPVAALVADFAALPLRATWLIRQLDQVVDGPGLATARAAGERWLRVRNALVETLQGFVVTLARRVPAWHVPLEDRSRPAPSPSWWPSSGSTRRGAPVSPPTWDPSWSGRCAGLAGGRREAQPLGVLAF